jgi:MoaA/NifB/PqqE/SkfB family radical SAM enzyme
MKCKNRDLMVIHILNGGNLLKFSHCCVLNNEDILVSPTDEFFNKNQNFLSGLQKVFSTNPENHNFYPKNNLCKNSTFCDFKYQELKQITVSTDLCNLHCKMCKSTQGMSYFKQTQDAYITILNKLRGAHLTTLQLSSAGEPFIFKDKLFPWLYSISNDTAKYISFVSNGTLVSPQEIRDLIIHLRKERVILNGMLSCDGITPDTYKEVRGIDAFQRVVDNALELKKFNAIGGINFVITPFNIHEVEYVPEFWLSKGIIPQIIFPLFHPEWEWMREDPRVKYIQNNYNQYFVNY